MTCTCKECGRKYTYNDEVGYSKDLCGPFCDGRHRRTDEIARLRALLREAKEMLEDVAGILCGDYMSGHADCEALAARIAAEVKETKCPSTTEKTQ